MKNLSDVLKSRTGLSNYTGSDDIRVNFEKDGGSFFNLNEDEPIQLVFTNNHATRNFYVHLSPGLDFRPGTVAGQIDPDGTFAGEGVSAALPDPGTNVDVTTGSSDQSIYKYNYWMQRKTTIISRIEVTPDDPTTFLTSNILVGKDHPNGVSRFKKIPLRKQASDKSFNLQFVNIFDNFIFSDEYIVKLLLPAASVTSVNVYFGGTISDTYEMESLRAAAVKTRLANPALSEATRNAGKVEEIMSNFNGRR